MALTVVVAGLLIWYFATQVSSRPFDWQLAGRTLLQVRWTWVLVSLVPIFGTYYGRALRWSVFLRPIKPKPSIGNLLSATIVGFTAITLFGRPGEFVRPYLIARKEQVPVTSQFAAWMLERIFDLLMALLLFAFALSKVQSSGLHVGEKLTWILAAGGKLGGALGGAILLILLSLRHFAEPLRLRLLRMLYRLPAHRVAKAEKLVNALFQGVESMRSDSAMILVLLYSVAEWVLICFCYWCLAQSFGDVIQLGVVDVLILMGFVSFGAVVQIPGVGGGLQVVAVLVLTELFGIRFELASAFALFLWLLTFVAIVPVGLIVALKEGLDWHSLRRIGEEETP
jgi:glycosyltransferase 2 family protein